MFTRLQITVALGVATLCWWIVLQVQGTTVSWQHLAPFTTVVSVLVVVALAMELWLWRLRPLQGWLFNRPDLRGTWKVTLQSEWVNPETGERAPPITAYAAIEQSLTKLQIHLMTPESESCLLAHAIEPTPCGNRFNVSVVYANTPGVELRGGRSERHVGAALLSTHGPRFKPDSITAEYWTDRKTVGRMTFEGRTATLYSRYEDAHRHFTGSGGKS
nr:hypothetical protein [uncultured Pseudoxanthomonas sp.]